MSAPILTLTTRINRPDDEVAAYLARPAAAARLTPPWFPPGTLFDDRAITTHIDPDGQSACLLTEELHLPDAANPSTCIDMYRQVPTAVPVRERAPLASYSLPATRYSLLLSYRHATLRDDLEHTAPYGHVRRLRIAIAGPTGLIGRALVPFLETQNHEVIPLRSADFGVRNTESQTTQPSAGHDATLASDNPKSRIQNPKSGGVPAADVLINLAGAPMFTPPWTQPRRDEIWQSRINTTRALIAALASLNPRPFAYLNASSHAYYGPHGHDPLDETAPRGAGFLADVFSGHEHEAQAALGQLGIRTAHLRFGHVLTPAGGHLATLLRNSPKKTVHQLGHGRQWTSWITIDDAIAAIYHAILTHACAGPVNISAPNPVTNADFTAALARALNKKPKAVLPRWALRLRYGIDYANETLLASHRLVPAKLQSTNYPFRHPTIEAALKHLLP